DAVMMITRARGVPALTCQRGIGIGQAYHAVVDGLITFGRAGVFQFAFLRLVSSLQRCDQFRTPFDDGALRSIGVDQTRIDVNLLAIHQASFNTASYRADKESFKDFFAPTLACF